MPFQIDSPSPKADSFRLQSKPLFNRMITAQFDLSSRTKNAVPG